MEILRLSALFPDADLTIAPAAKTKDELVDQFTGVFNAFLQRQTLDSVLPQLRGRSLVVCISMPFENEAQSLRDAAVAQVLANLTDADYSASVYWRTQAADFRIVVGSR